MIFNADLVIPCKSNGVYNLPSKFVPIKTELRDLSDEQKKIEISQFSGYILNCYSNSLQLNGKKRNRMFVWYVNLMLFNVFPYNTETYFSNSFGGTRGEAILRSLTMFRSAIRDYREQNTMRSLFLEDHKITNVEISHLEWCCDRRQGNQRKTHTEEDTRRQEEMQDLISKKITDMDTWLLSIPHVRVSTMDVRDTQCRTVLGEFTEDGYHILCGNTINSNSRFKFCNQCSKRFIVPAASITVPRSKENMTKRSYR